MPLTTPVLWSDAHELHRPEGEVWVGIHTAGTEVPERAEAIRAALDETGATFLAAARHPDSDVRRVHGRELLTYLARAYADWEAAGLIEDPGQPRVVPYIFPPPGEDGPAPSIPVAASARAGFFAYDTMSLIGPGTWEAARAAVDTALTAADLILGGERSAYALVRPPGHHATRGSFGGSCYLNNTAAAAAHLRARGGERVAVLDIDAHHGNGTQAIFWSEPEVLVGSVHVDPGAGWFPHFLGFAGERGAGPGAGANLNLPLAPSSGDREWLEAVGRLVHWAGEHGARSLVVALGVDAAGDDPESPLEVTAAGFRAAGEQLGALGLPTVFVQEGGYDLATIGELVVATLEGFESTKRP